MNIALWVVQVLTALAFGQHGYLILFQVEQARTRFAWTRDVSPTILRVVGIAEILGAIGVIWCSPSSSTSRAASGRMSASTSSSDCSRSLSPTGVW
jgi:hypothetical protein